VTLASALLAAAVCAPAGCYQKVVRAKGPGADQVTIEEPYQSNSKVDEWIFGPQPSKNRSLLDRRSQ
jgi:hypothetical protein